MKTRTIVGISLVVLLVFVVLWFFGRHSVTMPPPAEAVLAKAVGITNPPPTVSSAPTATNQDRNVLLATIEKAYRQGLMDKGEYIQKILDVENLKSLDFYGKVVDQHGQPVVGAKVSGSVLINVGLAHSGHKDYFTETDSQGEFQFVGIHGMKIGIWLEKTGYRFDSNLYVQRPPNWESHDPKNRVVFKMWKLKGPEPMVHSKINSAIPVDGTTVNFDLLTGKKASTGGDLTVKLLRNPINIVPGKSFDWSFTLEIHNGGFAEIADLYPNEAPADGYQSFIETNIPADMKNWRSNLTHSYYFNCRDGKVYGRMTVEFWAGAQGPVTGFFADIYVNPSGSRNLEYDRAKEIEPSQVLQKQTNQ